MRERTGSLKDIAQFRRDLLNWYANFRRDLPWRRTKDPYAIWVSEIMLQQTRVAAVIPYFERFLTRFPTVKALANASESDVLAHWAGLGYYYRARNMHRAARSIAQAGEFPSSHAAIMALPGIGDYTAAAVASMAFDLPHAVLDGNVYRVLSRLFADPTNIASSAGKKKFSALADQLLDRVQPGLFNQAVMELGATICLPKSPQCLLCPVASHCVARAGNQAEAFPVKISSKRSIKMERVVYWIERSGELLMWQRPANSRLMAGFWELPEAEQLPGLTDGVLLGEFGHGITIYNYRFRVIKAEPPADCGVCQWRSIAEINHNSTATPLSTIFQKAKRMVESPPTAAKIRRAAAGNAR